MGCCESKDRKIEKKSDMDREDSAYLECVQNINKPAPMLQEQSPQKKEIQEVEIEESEKSIGTDDTQQSIEKIYLFNKDQLNQLNELKINLKELNKLEPQDDDIYMMRYLIARKYNVKQAQKMFLDNKEWKIKNDVQSILQWKCENIQQVLDLYPRGYHGVDQKGRPIYLDWLGKMDSQKLAQIQNEQSRLKHYIQIFEYLDKVVFSATQNLQKKESDDDIQIHRAITILDLSHFNSSIPEVQAFSQFITALALNNYPQFTAKVYIIHPPKIFKFAWGLIKWFLDENTREKVFVYGDDEYKQKLLEDIDESELPEIYGGQCCCSGKGCHFSNKGPWNQQKLEVNAPLSN